MMQSVQRVKYDVEKGEFLLRINSQIVEVVKAVTAELNEEYGDAVKLQHLVWLESHPEHSVLVVSPSDPSASSALMYDMNVSMRGHVETALKARSSRLRVA